MYTLYDRLADQSQFLIGVELVTTRGTITDRQAVDSRSFATQLVHSSEIDWVSITDNAGGNPQLSPMALGKPILYAEKDVIIHLSCKDFNRHGLESQAWELSSEGFHNILALSGDYPAAGYHGHAKPVFDVDSVGLLTMLDEMNRGLSRPKIGRKSPSKTIQATNFCAGAVATNFKRHENEVMPQLFKLEKKIECGAKFIIAQIGFDARKSHELACYLQRRNLGHVPLVGNVFLLSRPAARFFHKKAIPGVVVSDRLLEECEHQAKGSDRGARYFKELAAKQMAIFRGLGFAGGYLGGVHRIVDVHEILDIESSFSSDDWKQFARELQYPEPDEFYYFSQDRETKLADPARLNEAYEESLRSRQSNHNVTFRYRMSKLVHDWAFTPGRRLYEWGKSIYGSSKNTKQGPPLLRIVEHASKAALFGCRDCGDCSLPDIAFLCPESQCAKNQRNGPCGGTRDGKCEVEEFECIWGRAYDRLKAEGREQQLLDHAPAIQDQSLRGTSSWANTLLGRDHAAAKKKGVESPSDTAAPDNSKSTQSTKPHAPL
ncbi:MAG: methylenetetrahydrofolate reductase C-terminal domain-containing protein [Pirellulales bacterium]|nr:methylenetetrahydrofolate reductase C-terminal domain-containing protein [Pirellulales bacterium]